MIYEHFTYTKHKYERHDMMKKNNMYTKLYIKKHNLLTIADLKLKKAHFV